MCIGLQDILPQLDLPLVNPLPQKIRRRSGSYRSIRKDKQLCMFQNLLGGLPREVDRGASVVL